MKKLIYLSLALIASISLLSSCQNMNASSNNTKLIPRTDTAGKSDEWNNIKKLFNTYQNATSKDANDVASKIKLIELYLNEARVTGNTDHYYLLAMQEINSILENKNTKPEYLYSALAHKASVLLSLHQFAEAKKYAQTAVELNPYEADIYGALIDANVELGNYKEAVDYCDKMLTIRPDIRSYSRASYIRQLTGDIPGAISAMQMAVDAGATGLENTEWARVKLADLYMLKNASDTAKLLFETALHFRPNYAEANMGLARVAMQAMQYDSAIAYCTKAINTISESSYISYLASIYQAQGNVSKAKEINNDVLKLLLENEQENKKATLIKHNGNRELAMAYLQVNDYTNALIYAKQDLTMRPSNMDANDLVAKIYTAIKDPANASLYQAKAMAKNISFSKAQ